jgi:hypothetical protein
MFLAAIPVVLYVIKIGGDPRHFRYLAFPYCLFIIATGGLVEELINSLHVFDRKSCLILALLIMLGTGMCYPRQLLHHPIYSHPFHASPKVLKTDHRGFFKIRDALVHRFYFTPFFSNNGSAIELKQIMIKWREQETHIPQSRILSTAGCLQAYKAFDSYIIQDLGLTEPFLARTIMKSNRPAHKQGLRPLAQDIAQVRKQHGFRKGGFEEMVKSGEAPLWIRNNLGTIQAIENKVYNDHHFGENILLALRPAGKIDP